MAEKKAKTVLFLCTGNSCRSQMAEGFARNILPKGWKIYSAGIRADGLNKHAVEVMKEVRIDISSQYSKTIDDLKDVKPDIVVTLCDNAKQSCPVYPGNVVREHWSLQDPADATGTEEERLKVYRSVRDEIWNMIELNYSPKNRGS